MKKILPFLLLIIYFAFLSVKIFSNDYANLDNYHVIAHSGGGMDNYTYMNALEAYYFEYEHGTRMFDADVRFTTDDVLVLRHEWTDNLGFINSSKGMTYEEFINTKMYEKYTPMSFEDLLDFMISHKDVYIHLDVKNRFEESYKQIVKLAEKKNCLNCLDRMVVSFYNYEDYFLIKEIYDFKYYAIRKYPNFDLDINDILQFCIENQIQYLSIMEQYFTEDILNLFHNNKIKVNVAVIDGEKACKYAKMGVDGIVSNFVTENDFIECLKNEE